MHLLGGPGGIRTLDLSDANRTLSQLSYRPLYLVLDYYTRYFSKCQEVFCNFFIFSQFYRQKSFIFFIRGHNSRSLAQLFVYSVMEKGVR